MPATRSALRETMQYAVDEMGEMHNLTEAVDAVPPLNADCVVIDHLYDGEFVMAELSPNEAAHYLCGRGGPGVRNVVSRRHFPLQTARRRYPRSALDTGRRAMEGGLVPDLRDLTGAVNVPDDQLPKNYRPSAFRIFSTERKDSQ